jgi:RNA polymerase sigma-B factor
VGVTSLMFGMQDIGALQSVDVSRDDLVIDHLGLAGSIARRYAGRGEPEDDLRQVGTIGLVKAADQFDRLRGTKFVTYAYTKIRGEIQRHFRDKCWAIRVPRKTQELNFAVASLRNTLSATFGRQANNAEIATRLDVSATAVSNASEVSSAYRPLSLDAAIDNGGSSYTALELLGNADPEIESAAVRTDITVACSSLDEHERLLVRLRFFEDLTQQTIGGLLGKSQMYVSRLEKRTLEKLRCSLLGVGSRPGDTSLSAG